MEEQGKAEREKQRAKIGIRSVDVTVQGIKGAPLVIHAFAEKAKQEIRDKQQKKERRAKKERNPEQECETAKYVDEQGRECAPITALKKSMVSAATAFDGMTKVGLRQAIFVDSIANPGSALVPIETLDGGDAKSVMREDAVTIGINTRSLAYRPEYKEWRLRLRVEYNSRIISEEQLLALIDQAGWGVGICEGRPEKTSALGWGRFERA